MTKLKEYYTHSEAETEQAARDFAACLIAGDFIAFFGTLGSGKTAFTRGLASVFCPDAHVSSPTYAIVNEYPGSPSIFHFDVYRVPDDDSLFATGFYDYFDRGGLMVCEWCENIPFALPDDRYEIHFEKLSETDRKITVLRADA